MEVWLSNWYNSYHCLFLLGSHTLLSARALGIPFGVCNKRRLATGVKWKEIDAKSGCFLKVSLSFRLRLSVSAYISLREVLSVILIKTSVINLLITCSDTY